MSSRERVCGCILAGVFFLLFFDATEINFYTMQLDSAFMVEMIDTTYQSGVPRTHLTKSVIQALDTLVWTPPERICQMPLTPESAEPMNEFDRHSFLALYLTVPFHLFFGAKAIAFFLNALSFTGLLGLVYAILRERGVSILGAASMAFLVSTHPVWSRGAFGQLGPDRYFPPLGLLYMFLLYERLVEGKMRSAAIVVVGLLSILVTERSSAMIGMATMGGLALYRGTRGWRRSDLLLGAIAAVAIGYPLVYGALFQNNPDYAGFRNSAAYFVSDLMHKPEYVQRLGEFLLIDILLFGILGAVEWRPAAIALGAMLPNIVGSNGGAEKTGWSTHYHAMYFPFLVFAVLIGFAHLWKVTRNSGWRHLAIAIPIILGSCLALLDPYSTGRYFDFSAKHLRDYAVLKAVEFQTNTGPAASVIFFSKLAREVAGAVPPGSEVTTVEGLMPALYGGRLIHFYPLGLMSSDYAVLPYVTGANGAKRFTGAVSYLGPEAVNALDDCLNQRLQSAGYSSVRDFPSGGGSGMAVLKRGQAGAGVRD